MRKQDITRTVPIRCDGKLSHYCMFRLELRGSGRSRVMPWPVRRRGRGWRPALDGSYLMAKAFGGEPMPPGALSGTLTKNTS